MKILLWTDDLMSRVRIASRWQAAGATVLKQGTDEVPDVVVLDLDAANALDRLRELAARYPQAELIAYGPHVDGQAFKEARQAGATEVVARGKVVERLLPRIA